MIFEQFHAFLLFRFSILIYLRKVFERIYENKKFKNLSKIFFINIFLYIQKWSITNEKFFSNCLYAYIKMVNKCYKNKLRKASKKSTQKISKPFGQRKRKKTKKGSRHI